MMVGTEIAGVVDRLAAVWPQARWGGVRTEEYRRSLARLVKRHDLDAEQVGRGIDAAIDEWASPYPPSPGELGRFIREASGLDADAHRPPPDNGPIPGDVVRGLSGRDLEQVEQAWEAGTTPVAVRALADELRRAKRASGGGG